MKLPRGIIWPVLVVAALLFTVGVNVVMLVAASSDRNGSVVEPDYYRKGVEWDRTMAERAASARLGWSANAALSALRADATGGTDPRRELTVALRDPAGAPIPSALVEVVLIHNTDAANVVRSALLEVAPGDYRASLPLRARGRWEVRVDASGAGARFVATLHAEAP